MVPDFLNTRVVVFCAVALALILGILGLSQYHSFELPSYASSLGSSSSEYPAGSLTDFEAESKQRDFLIKEIWKPSVSIDTPKYKPYGAFEWELPKHPRWNESMGEDLCILDLDSRPLNEDGQLFGGVPLSWEIADSLHGPSLGTLQHWLYAKIHGYRYYFVQTDSYDDRRASWKKPTIIPRILQKHKACIFVDSDAIFNHLDLPFEWLLNYWDIKRGSSEHAVAMAIDPNLKENKDERGNLYLNTGFVIAQNQPTTFQMMEDWEHCPDEGGKYPNCTEYRSKSFGHPSDQGGFGNYVRYDYKDHIKELPCSEANGYPEHKSECLGIFIKHLWLGKKDHIKVAVGQQLPQPFLAAFHKEMLADKESFYIMEKDLLSDDWLEGS